MSKEDNYDINIEKELYNQHLNDLSRVNYLFYVKIGIVIYPMWSLIDYITGNGSWSYYLLLRLLFTLPIFLIYFGVRNRRLTNIDLWVFLTFVVAGAGASVASFYVGGINSGYINGLLFLSFVQFTVIPIHIRYILLIDIAYILLYFPLNFIPFNETYNVLIKEMAIYINFALFKFLCAKKAQSLIYGTMEQYGRTKDLKNNKEVASLFGELCHLISNPLFIARENIKKIKKTTKDENIYGEINSAFQSMERITAVVKKMQKLHRSENLRYKEYKKGLNDEL